MQTSATRRLATTLGTIAAHGLGPLSCAIALVAVAGSASTAYALPDLVPEVFGVSLATGDVDPGDVVEGCAGAQSGRRLLRFSLRTRNIGATDLVLGDPGCPDCATHPGEACANPLYVCSEAHGHPHFEGFARIELLTTSGAVVGESRKIGFCLLDLECASPQYSCGFQGISAGCSDVYDASLPCQYIDLTDVSLPNGTYVLRVTLDPENLLPESDETNNVVSLPIHVGPATPPTCPVFASTDVPKPIPDLGMASSSLVVPAGQPITSVRVVDLRGHHTYVRDLEVHLWSPSGTDVTVINRVCADHDDFALDLADDGGTAIPCPPTDGGVHQPSSPLSAFAGEPRGGTWTLDVFDREGIDEGDLDAWGLAICGPCGNGVVDSGEACDDGNALDGDCCSADCQTLAPDGTSCSDGNACTAADSCSNGACVGSGSVSCDPCLTCYPEFGCVPPFTTVCEPAAAGKSHLSLRRAGAGARDRLSWTWKPTVTILPGDFGLPATSTDLHLCLFDGTGLKWSGTAPAGGTCGSRPCWSERGSIGYRDRDGTPDGVARMTLKSGTPAQARIGVVGKGPLLALPPLDLDLPATLRVKRGDGSPICWETKYPAATRNAPDAFDARNR